MKPKGAPTSRPPYSCQLEGVNENPSEQLTPGTSCGGGGIGSGGVWGLSRHCFLCVFCHSRARRCALRFGNLLRGQSLRHQVSHFSSNSISSGCAQRKPHVSCYKVRAYPLAIIVHRAQVTIVECYPLYFDNNFSLSLIAFHILVSFDYLI